MKNNRRDSDSDDNDGNHNFVSMFASDFFKNHNVNLKKK
jgi:hypothetical protein